jgi:DMSO/TMAO reductase YedYZ molybdopterin-dependent catalytic subunit
VRLPSLKIGALLGALTSVPVLALNALGEILSVVSFVPFDLFDWLARILPGDVITFGIDLIVTLISTFSLGSTSDAAKLVEQVMAVALAIFISAIFGLILALVARRSSRFLLQVGAFGAGVLTAGIAFIQLSLSGGITTGLLWTATLYIAWGISLAWLIQQSAVSFADQPESALSRRGFIAVVGGSVAGISLGSWVIANIDRSEPTPPIAQPEQVDTTATNGPAASPPEDVLAARIEPAPGTRSEISSNEDFYRIDINTRKPRLDPETWRLELGGLVKDSLSLSLDELRALPKTTQVITLSCISNRIGGDLISTSRWGGVQFREVLALAGVRDGAQEIKIESADGFYESVKLEDGLDEGTLLVYEMNGVPLLHQHGFPLRIYIPNRYGMKQPKWITNMEVIDERGPGYWVERGWSPTAFVNTTSVIDSVAVEQLSPDAPTIPVGGIAFSGDQGISQVEVQVDEGPWLKTTLRSPALSPLAWVQWRLDWEHSPGKHTFRVRAYDANGQLQELSQRPVRPDGATGVHSITLNI